MGHDLKDIIKETKKSIKKSEEKFEDFAEDFNDEVKDFWKDLKKQFFKVEEKLEDSFMQFEGNAELQGHLGMMEARDRVEHMREAMDEFALKVSDKTQEELDTVALKAHLAKMESDDFWSEREKEISQMYEKSKIEVEQMSQKAGKEMNTLFLKLSEIV